MKRSFSSDENVLRLFSYRLVISISLLHNDAKCSIEGMMAANNRISVNLNSDEYLALSELSARYQVSLAWLARRAIADLLEQYLKDPDQLKMPFVNINARRSQP